MDWGASFSVNNGKSVRFWEDVWIRPIPLKLVFPKLYDFSYTKNCTVSDYRVGGEWRIPFRRSLGVAEVRQWEDMLEMLGEISLNDDEDQIFWVHEKAGNYSTRSMYRAKLHRGVVNTQMQRVWSNRLPMKLKSLCVVSSTR